MNTSPKSLTIDRFARMNITTQWIKESRVGQKPVIIIDGNATVRLPDTIWPFRAQIDSVQCIMTVVALGDVGVFLSGLPKRFQSGDLEGRDFVQAQAYRTSAHPQQRWHVVHMAVWIYGW
jgi:hypothetical protein